MSFEKVLIANRGEIAIRITRALADLGIHSVALYSEDDSQSRHWRWADQAAALSGVGAKAYLDSAQILALAQQTQCQAIHPGYGFLSENAEFAQACTDAGITFIGPRAEALALFGNKISARHLAEQCGVPLLKANTGTATLASAKEFFQQLSAGAMLIKAAAGGGGRGMAIITANEQIDDSFARCQSEANSAFGSGELYVEEMLPSARHIEVQIIADNHGNVSHLWERDCSVQRRHQKIIEIAPSPRLANPLRQAILDSAISMATQGHYNNIGTFEFLIDNEGEDRYVFIETNPRLQVEHTITEAITGVDIVKTQVQIAAGKSLAELQLIAPPARTGYALQLRINAESFDENSEVKPSGGTITQLDLPSGPGVRIDTYAYSGYTSNPNFDSLLAKIICHSQDQDFAKVIHRSQRALRELSIRGLQTNRGFLATLLQDPALQDWNISTRYVDLNLAALNREADTEVDDDSLDQAPADNTDQQIIPAHLVAIRSPIQGTVIQFLVAVDEPVHREQDIAIIESMKMEHVIKSVCDGIVAECYSEPGRAIFANAPLLSIRPEQVKSPEQESDCAQDPHEIRPDLQEVIDRHRYGLDEARPDAVARRRKTQQRTVRENINDLIDDGSFIEYGPLVIAAQRARRSLQELLEKTPGDGLVGGMGRVNGDEFGSDASQCIAMSYDYTVLAGTQGQKNHRKKDRLFELAEQWRLPVVIFAEGGGGRPGETERNSASGLDCLAFYYFAKLKGLCPLVSIVSGRCFAGNAVLLGCADVIIATENSNIGMGGPAMIEGGGLGVYQPEQVGPVEDQCSNGVIDVLVTDEQQAVQVAKKYLGYFQGDLGDWNCADQHLLRTVIPENRLRVYDVKQVIELLADTDSVLELRKDFALGMVTALARVEGKAVGIVANNPIHLGGAIDSEGSDKAARFIQLCNAFAIPIVFLCDTPGIMVGPDAEKTALVRHAARLFVAGAAATVPFFTVILRKAYGLGAQTMAGGSFKAAFFTISWPSGEFGGMGLEGAVKLGYRNEIAAIEDPEQREAYFQEMVAKMYELGKATSVATYFDLDDVIDPKDTRHWITRGLEATKNKSNNHREVKPFVDTW